ncbi:MAG TPA: hypothetical protein VL131_10550, partial [Gammaproteobacteria bacterium]|nr:hypothetical protein [Gammaproteobacteria bacterium]
DFRAAVWSAGPELSAREAASIALAPPAAGYRASFAEVRYGRWLSAFSLSTNLAVLPAPDTPELGPRPRGTAGVCSAAAEAR